MNKNTAHIDDWVYDGNVLFGHVTKHDRQGSFKRTYQQTSPVIDINMVEGYAETQNTRYTLGPSGTWEKIRDITINEQLAEMQLGNNK